MYAIPPAVKKSAASGRKDADMSAPASSTVSDVTPVAPAIKRYRATLVRTTREVAIVEFTAPETANTYAMRDQLFEAVPADAWTPGGEDEWGRYIDRIEEIA